MLQQQMICLSRIKNSLSVYSCWLQVAASRAGEKRQYGRTNNCVPQMATQGSKSKSVPVRAHVKTPNLTAEKTLYVSIANLHIHDNCTGGTLVFFMCFILAIGLYNTAVASSRANTELLTLVSPKHPDPFCYHSCIISGLWTSSRADFQPMRSG